MKQLYTSIFFFLSFANVFAQAELSFSDNLACANDTYCVDLEINAASGTFEIGTSSFLVTYDDEVLTYSNYTPTEFDATTAACSGVWAAQRTDLDETKGQFGLTIKLLNNSGGCVSVGNSSIVIGTVCFDINAQGAIPNITFDDINTRINRRTPDNGSVSVSISSVDTLNTPNSLACDCSGAGDPCDDLNVFTINDQYDIYCNCAGTLADVDLDGIYDGVDNCMDTFYEAENGNYNWSGFNNGLPQYNGTGFLDYQNQMGDTLSFPIIIDSLGEYDLIFRYANGDGTNRELKLIIDSVVVADPLVFPPSGGWSTWTEINLTDSLTADTHMVYLITAGVHGPNLDRIAISSCGNCAMAGTSCDDGDPCTDSDTYDTDCNCKGVYSDTDNDTVCDNQDICPDGDDNIDTDMDGIPDDCDDCDNGLIGQTCDDGDPCTINDIYDSGCNCSGTFSGSDSDMDGVCDANDMCAGFDDNLDIDNDGIPDDCDSCNDLTVGQPCDDGNPCTILDTVTPGCGCGGIPIYLELTATIDTIECNGDFASIDLLPEHMVGGVYYKWNTGAFTADLTNLSPGTYTVTATDWRNCAAIETFVITEPAPIDLSFSTVSSNGSNGEIDLSVSGGTSPYTYLWEDSTMTQDLSGLASDRFHVTVTDSLNCIVNGFVDVKIDTMCVDTLFQYEYGEKINMQTNNYDFAPAMDGYIRFGHNDAHSSVTHYYDFPEFGKYEFNIRHAESSRDRTVNIYLDGVLKHAALFIPKTGSNSVFHNATFTIDSIPPGIHTIMTERNTTSNNNPRLDYLAVCKTETYDCVPLNGSVCDDGNPCTINDEITNCDCAGTFADSDNDGVCDADDICAGSDDSIDSDADGIPDGCDDCYALKYEAEDAVRISLSKKTGGSGWTGTGYIDYNSKTGDTLRFFVNTELAGSYNISLRYAINKSDRFLDVFVNNVLEIDSLFFPNTGSVNTKWESLTFSWNLIKGQNIIELITAGAHGPNIDYLTVCLPNYIHEPVIANQNDGFEAGLNNWTEITFNGNDSPLINESTANVLCGLNSMEYRGASGIEKLYADIDYLKIDTVYTLHFYAAGETASGYIGLPDQIFNGIPFNVDASSGNGDFVHHSVTFTATAPTMRVWFEFNPFTPITLDAFSFDNSHCFIDIAPKALLSGAYDTNTNLMYDSLRTKDLIPLTEPYSALSNFTHKARGGGETIAPSVLQTTGNDAIVDWVILEIRDKNDSTLVLSTKSALIQRDGDIVGLDGTSNINFRSVFADDYYFAIRHRNHAGVMTASPISLGNGITSIDFTNPLMPTLGLNAQKNIGEIMALWSGDVNGDGLVKYNGWENDRVSILSEINYADPDSVIINKYSSSDVNMDGNVKYNNIGNDREIILDHVGIPTRNNIKSGNIPGIGLTVPDQNLEIRAFNNGTDNIVEIQMRCTAAPCPASFDGMADVVFGLKWATGDGIDLGASSNSFLIDKSDVELTLGNFEYQAFGINNLLDFQSDWVIDNWETLTTIPVEKMDVPSASIEICEPSFQISVYPNIHLVMGDNSGIDFTPIIANTVNDIPMIGDDYVDNDGDGVSNSNDCNPNDANDGTLVINNNPLTSSLHESDNRIESAAILENNANVTYKATRSIELLPGFSTTSNSVFSADIEDICNVLNASIAGVDISCFGETDGSATASATEGDGNYSFIWNTGATTATISNLAVGTYFVTISDGIGRMESDSVSINYDLSDSDGDLITDGCDCDPNNFSDGLTPTNDNPLSSNTYNGANRLTSEGVVEVDSSTTFKATLGITLLPGFNADYGSLFSATIEDVCILPSMLVVENDTDEIDNLEIDLPKEEIKSEKNTNSTVILIPNPTSDYFQIKSEIPFNEFGIYDLYGKLILKGGEDLVDISNFANGTYIVRVFFDEKAVVKIITKQ